VLLLLLLTMTSRRLDKRGNNQSLSPDTRSLRVAETKHIFLYERRRHVTRHKLRTCNQRLQKPNIARHSSNVNLGQRSLQHSNSITEP
jgi:hypothetical protein